MLTDEEYLDITKRVLDPYLTGWPPPAHLSEMATENGFTIEQAYEGLRRRCHDQPHGNSGKSRVPEPEAGYYCSVCGFKRNRDQFYPTLGVCRECRKAQLQNGATKSRPGPRRGKRKRQRISSGSSTERNAT